MTGSYRQLCDAIDECDGTVRLARLEQGWGLTVTLGVGEEDSPPRAGGFFFAEIGELDLHAGLILAWLERWQAAKNDSISGGKI